MVVLNIAEDEECDDRVAAKIRAVYSAVADLRSEEKKLENKWNNSIKIEGNNLQKPRQQLHCSSCGSAVDSAPMVHTSMSKCNVEYARSAARVNTTTADWWTYRTLLLCRYFVTMRNHVRTPFPCCLQSVLTTYATYSCLISTKGTNDRNTKFTDTVHLHATETTLYRINFLNTIPWFMKTLWKLEYALS